MSIEYCEKHDRRFDSDFVEGCPMCAFDELEHEYQSDGTLRRRVIAFVWAAWALALAVAIAWPFVLGKP